MEWLIWFLLNPHFVFPFVLVTVAVLVFLFNAIRWIGPTEVGLVTKRIGRQLPDDNPIALHGEAGYQIDILMPGLRFVFWPIFSVEKFPWVRVPAGGIGVVVAQVGKPLPIGAKSARYKSEFGNFTETRTFLEKGGEKGVQRPVLSPGTIIPVHPIAFLVITREQVYGQPLSPEFKNAINQKIQISCKSFGLEPSQLDLVRIEPQTPAQNQEVIDMVGIVTTFDGAPLPSGLIASRLGNFDDVKTMETKGVQDADIVDTLMGSQNNLHNNYQDFQSFLDRGGKIGLQHDPLLYGAYTLNPFLVQVEHVPMLVVRQGEVAVVKAYVGLSVEDTSGTEFKFGALVRPGHRGVWREPLRTGKYPINPRCYQPEIVPTAIITLNWAEGVSEAHSLDRKLRNISAKSREGFVFSLDLQVQIHVADVDAPWVISTVGTMQNLVNEVLQAVVSNHFRDQLRAMSAIQFIETRQQVQRDAQAYLAPHLLTYKIATKGVFIQDAALPVELVHVLTQRQIANQEIETYRQQKEAQETRIAMEQAKGTADMQAELSRSQVEVDIKSNNAEARKREADGEATYIRETGAAKGAEVEAIGLARAKGYEKQVAALGPQATAMVNLASALAESKNRFVPEVLVTGGGGAGGALEGLAATLIGQFRSKKAPPDRPPDSPTETMGTST